MRLYIKLLIFVKAARCVFLELGTELLIYIKLSKLRSLLIFVAEVLSSEMLLKFR